MKIALYHNLPSGGAKRSVYELTIRLNKSHRVDVYSLACADHDFCDLRPVSSRHVVFPFTPLPLAHSPFGRLNPISRSVDLLRLKKMQAKVARQIDAEGYDVVFLHNCRYGNAPALISYLKTPTVFYCHEPPRVVYDPPIPRPYSASSKWQKPINKIDPLPALYRNLLIRMDRTSVLAASRVLVNSAYSRENFYRIYGIFPWISYLGVDVDSFRPLSIPKENFLLSVGALGSHKGFDFLLHSLDLVAAQRKLKLVIVSNQTDPIERSYLQNMARQSGITLEFRTLVDDDELVRLYNQALLTIYAPIMEPFGFVPIESMACGTPVVAIREGGVRETVVNGETGLLTERDPRSFADAIEILLSDSIQREQLGRQSRNSVEKQWQWDTSVQNIERHLIRTAQEGSQY